MSTLQLGDKAPNFDAETSEGKINFYDYLGESLGICSLAPQITLRFAPQNWAR